MNKQELLKEISAKEAEIKEKQADIDGFAIDVDEHEGSYCDMLDKKTVYVGNIAFSPSAILRELDPTAYRCGLIDYVDGLDIEYDSKYQGLQEEFSDLEVELEKLKEQLDELENEN